MTTTVASLNSALDRRRRDSTLEAPTPAGIVIAGVVAVVASVAASFGLAQLGRAIFTVPATFDKFNFAGYAVLTVGGVIGATLAWALVSRYAPNPTRLLAQLAVVVSALLLVPDVWLFTQAGNPTGPVVMLMVMHIVIGVVSFLALTTLAPVRRAAATRLR